MKQEQMNIIDIQSLAELYRLRDGDPASGRVIVSKELFFNSSSAFGSYLCSFEGGEEKINISGVFLDRPEIYRTYHVRGERSTYQGRPQIKANQFELTYPKTKLSNFIFLLSVPDLARHTPALVTAYPTNAVEAMMSKSFDELVSPESLKLYATQEPGFIQDLRVHQPVLQNLFLKSIMLSKLLSLNLSKSAARKIYELFGSESYDVLSKNPYVILEHYEDLGYGLSFCDIVAMKFGFKADDHRRFKYGVVHAIQTASQAGHVYLPKEEFLSLLKKELSVYIPSEKLYVLSKQHSKDFVFNYFNQDFSVSHEELSKLVDERTNFANDAYERSILLYQPTDKEVEKAMNEAIDDGLVVDSKNRIYSNNLYSKEVDLSIKIRQILDDESANSPFRQHPLNISKAVDKFNLEERQLEACVESLSQPGGLYIISGPAGSGKTYVIKTLIEAYKSIYKKKQSSIILMAPTGRAARRIQESTGYPAFTIHRALKMDPDKIWMVNSGNPLIESFIIVDEFSMVDTEMAFRLFDAIKLGSKVVLVGDIKQLPPVGPGNVLRDMIYSGKIPLVELNVIKRQQDKSDIIENSVRVTQGKPLYEGGKNKDAFVLYRSYNDKMQQTLLTSIKKIQDNKGLDLEQIQVLIPQRKSRIGTYHINHLIQGEFNPNPDSDIIGNQFAVYDSVKRRYEDVTTYYRVGDKVINVKNSYRAVWYDKTSYGEYVEDKSMTIITNGEIGIIEEIVKPKRAYGEKFTNRIIVRIDNKYIFFDDDFDNLEFAYAITVHKAQGSQWKACIYMVSGSHKKMLTNNLMYTAMTRPSEFLVVIGDEKAINDGIANDVIEKRNTTLIEYLSKGIN